MYLNYVIKVQDNIWTPNRTLNMTGRKKILLNSFNYVNFNYCQLSWYFTSRKAIKKLKAYKKSIKFSPK